MCVEQKKTLHMSEKYLYILMATFIYNLQRDCIKTQTGFTVNVKTKQSLNMSFILFISCKI